MVDEAEEEEEEEEEEKELDGKLGRKRNKACLTDHGQKLPLALVMCTRARTKQISGCA